MLIQFVLVSVFLLLLVRVVQQRTSGTVFKVVWGALILLACYVVAFPRITNRVAAIAGVGRGVDLIIYLCIAIGAYFLTGLHIRLKQNELNVARIVQRLALETYRSEQLEIERDATRQG